MQCSGGDQTGSRGHRKLTRGWMGITDGQEMGKHSCSSPIFLFFSYLLLFRGKYLKSQQRSSKQPSNLSMSRSFFAPEGGGQSAQDTRLNLGPSSSTTTEYRRYSPPPTSSSGAAATSEDKQPFLPNGGHSDQGSIGRAASTGGGRGLGSASAGGASDSLAGMKALPPILSYCSASIMMTVINKVRSCAS